MIFAQGQAQRRVPMYMANWVEKLIGFLVLNDREILNNAGSISHEIGKETQKGNTINLKKLNKKRLKKEILKKLLKK